MAVIALIFLAIALTTFAFWQALNDPQQILWSAIKFGLLILAVICAGFSILAAFGGLGAVVAFGLGLYISIGAVLAGLVLAVLLPGQRKWFAGIIGVLFPVTVFLSAGFGYFVSPDSGRDRIGASIVDALEAYHADNGDYPTSLDRLVPDYLRSVPQPSTIWGWLYTANGQDYTLGYVEDVVWWGYFICIRTPQIHNWDCVFPDDENYIRVSQFDLPLTPFPGTPFPYTNP